MSFLNRLKAIIYRYAVKMKIELTVDCYLSGEDILKADEKYNIVFLDYRISDETRIKTAQLIKRQNSFCFIVLICREGVFAGDVFKVSPSGCLTHPITEMQVFGLLNEFFNTIGIRYPLLVKSEGDTFCLNTGEIIYIEADNKRCRVHLEEKCISCNKTMAKVYEELPKRVFLKINRAFVINFAYVNRFNNDSVVLKNGERLYISRNYFKSFKEDYINLINELTPY